MASAGAGPRIGSVDPTAAWERLGGAGTVLVDVRTRAEWNYVGVPDLSGFGKDAHFIEWQSFPDMSINPRFVAEVLESVGAVEAPTEILFICRSGVRSLHAAKAVAAHLEQAGQGPACFNVEEGFEGDLNPEGHRGGHNGWKARGLAWRQS
jgi:rhodanese-related sulfurtransferase